MDPTIIPAIILYALWVFMVYSNASVDSKIEEVCNDVSAQFASKGYSIRYGKAYTGVCVPRGSVPVRILIFRKTQSNPEP